MYRFMIADDEDEERRGIQFLLNRSGFSFEFVEAVDGREALMELQKQPADILFTDVKMPFMDGIELATEARKLYPDIQIIFFSGYDDFEFVKRALSLQAVDYILKPVNPSELEKIITMVVERMGKERKESSLNRQFHKNYVLSRLLSQVPFGKLSQEYDRERLRFLEDYTRLILMEFDEDFFGVEAADMRTFAGLFKGVIPFDYDFLDLTPSQGIFFLKSVSREDDYVKEVARCIHLEVEKEYKKSCYLSVSRKIAGPEDIGRAYESAESALEERFFYKESYVYPLSEKKQPENRPVVNDGRIPQVIEKDVACHDVYSLKKDMSILLDQCRSNSFQSYIYTRFICANLLQILFQDIPDSGLKLAGMVEDIYSCTSFDDLEKILWSAVEELEAQLTPEKDSPKHTVALVEQYIREHYQDVLSLDILAEKVYLTPHYLSSIFIQEKGIGINKYIKNARMEKARELLLSTNMKISDVCEQVGYSNLSYFCRSFRNEYGVTPDQYRR